jgi:hypothetical protein
LQKDAGACITKIQFKKGDTTMENFENGLNKTRNVGIGFIKSRKADYKVMDYCERMIVAAEKEGCDLLFVDVDRDGGRDIDRTQLDTIYSAMEVGSISHIFVRRLKDITDDIADLMEFHRTAAERGVSIRVVNVESDESEMETEDAWNGGMEC